MFNWLFVVPTWPSLKGAKEVLVFCLFTVFYSKMQCFRILGPLANPCFVSSKELNKSHGNRKPKIDLFAKAASFMGL